MSQKTFSVMKIDEMRFSDNWCLNVDQVKKKRQTDKLPKRQKG